jgi:hypothetical protein
MPVRSMSQLPVHGKDAHDIGSYRSPCVEVMRRGQSRLWAASVRQRRMRSGSLLSGLDHLRGPAPRAGSQERGRALEALDGPGDADALRRPRARARGRAPLPADPRLCRDRRLPRRGAGQPRRQHRLVHAPALRCRPGGLPHPGCRARRLLVDPAAGRGPRRTPLSGGPASAWSAWPAMSRCWSAWSRVVLRTSVRPAR